MDQRMIIEMGMGNDLHGMDYQKAAARAIEDAFRHSTLPIFATLDIPTDTMRVQVTVGVQEPDKIDAKALAAELPRGRAEVRAVKGGMNTQSGDQIHVVATAAIEAYLPDLAGKYTCATQDAT